MMRDVRPLLLLAAMLVALILLCGCAAQAQTPSNPIQNPPVSPAPAKIVEPNQTAPAPQATTENRSTVNSSPPTPSPGRAWQTPILSNDPNLSLFDRYPYEWWSHPNFTGRMRAQLGPNGQRFEGASDGVAPSGIANLDNQSALLLEFMDYGCIHCGEARNLTRAALAKYPDLALQWRHFPLPQLAYSRAEALGAQCAGDQGKFWAFSNAMMDDPSGVDFDKEYRLANASGVANMTLWAICTKSQWHADVLSSDLGEATTYHVNATPTFVLHGQVFQNTGDEKEFLDFVSSALASNATS